MPLARALTLCFYLCVCVDSGYQFAGLEFGADCHCGNRISSTRAPEEDCGLVCRGERGSPCGGVGRLSIYKVDGQLPGHRKCELTRLVEEEALFLICMSCFVVLPTSDKT